MPSFAHRINALPDAVQARKDFISRQPMGRLGTVDDMLPLITCLASDESIFATGRLNRRLNRSGWSENCGKCAKHHRNSWGFGNC